MIDQQRCNYNNNNYYHVSKMVWQQNFDTSIIPLHMYTIPLGTVVYVPPIDLSPTTVDHLEVKRFPTAELREVPDGDEQA